MTVDINKQYLNELVKVIVKLGDRDEVIDLLYGILTPRELEQILKRLQIVKKLKQGVPQREIAEDLDVGIATVTRGSREIRKGRFKYIGSKG